MVYSECEEVLKFPRAEGKNLVFTHHSIVHCLSVTVGLKLYIKSTWRSLCK